MVKVTQSDLYGREITAQRDIMAGEVLMLCELLVLSKNDTKVVNSTDLQYYTFKYNNTQDCLVLGLGEIFNHSDSPNVTYKIVKHDGRDVMEFRAIKDIKDGMQCFIDYTHDTQVDTTSYKVNLV